MGTFILRDILIIFLISLPVVVLFRRLHLPSILGFLVTGALIGPHALKLIPDIDQIEILAELGVTLLLFSVGLKFSYESFRRLKRQGLLSGLLQIVLTVLAGMTIGYFFHWESYRGIYFGCIIALSSTAVVLTTLGNLKRLDSPVGRLSTVILILQDLALIPMMIFLPWMANLDGGQSAFGAFSWQILKAVALVLGAILFTRYLANPLLRQVSRAKSREIFTIAVISLALGIAWLTYRLDLSFALGAFLAGVAVGTTEFQYQALSEVKPFQFSFNSLFFVSIGMLLNLEFLKEHYALVLLLVILIPLLKTLITSGILYLNRLPMRLAIAVGISLAQIGEFSFLLAFLGQRLGVISPFFYQLIVAIAVLSLMGSPLVIAKATSIADFLASLPGLRALSLGKSELKLFEETKRMKDHVVICGFGPLGEALGNILKSHRIPYLVLELNPDTIKKIRSQESHAFYGDGASEEILYKSGIERAKLLAITVPDFLNSAAIIRQAHQINSEIKIITRAKYRSEVDKLYAAGADIVISEELEGGLEMGRYALKLLGIEQNEADAFLNKIREFGSADFF